MPTEGLPRTLNYQTWVLKVPIHCEGCKRKVKKVLRSIEGVYTIAIDSQQHKVTVTGDIDSVTLIKTLCRSGKQAVMWPEKIGGKENMAAKAKNGEKPEDSNASDEDSSDEEKDQNPTHRNSEANVTSTKNVRFEAANIDGNVQISGGKASPESGPAAQKFPAIQQKGGGNGENISKASGGKKKKKKGRKVNKSSSPAFTGTPAGTGCDTHIRAPVGVAGQVLAPVGVAGQVNLSPPRQHLDPEPSYSYIPYQAHTMSFSGACPNKVVGPTYTCYVCPPPYTCSNMCPQMHIAQAAPLDSFEIFSDENPNGCRIM